MATTPAPPTQTVALSISGPISADIQAVCKAVSDVMTFLATPEGQLTVKSWRTSADAFNSAVEKAATWIENLFTGKLS